MENVLLVVHLILALAIIALVLLQRSEGGGLVGSGSGGLGGFSSARGTANALSRMTAICAGLFFCTSLGLAIMAGGNRVDASVLDQVTQQEEGTAAVPSQAEIQKLLDQAQQDGAAEVTQDAKPAEPQVPISE